MDLSSQKVKLIVGEGCSHRGGYSGLALDDTFGDGSQRPGQTLVSFSPNFKHTSPSQSRGRKWDHVKPRRRRTWDNVRSNKTIGGRSAEVSTFFFTSFLEEMRPKEMYDELKGFDDIDEIIIPLEKYIGGRRYGFVIVFNVQDERLLAAKLDNIFVGNQKLLVNLQDSQGVKVER
ncbi:hypothetical protein KIW84_013115 [Lathyrus oleraceus]|uniref:RRM domain-containing protein n=1 Tax=Pisum sativum TaxID=3888 RepID=A0A9D5BJF3_PEA|nr:hypothetical protein KIW84_013115 [Pisum sativum]